MPELLGSSRKHWLLLKEHVCCALIATVPGEVGVAPPKDSRRLFCTLTTSPFIRSASHVDLSGLDGGTVARRTLLSSTSRRPDAAAMIPNDAVVPGPASVTWLPVMR